MSKTRIAINGFGRIGRLFFRALHEQNFLSNEVEVVAVNDLVDADNLAYLLKYDSVHGKFSADVKNDSENIIVDDQKIKVLSEKKHPSELPWHDLNIDIVIEATGFFAKRPDAEGHLKAGAKKVIISQPSDPDVPTYLVGVNDNKYNGENLISNASCTTNCLAPLVYVLQKEGIGLSEGLMTTIHSYTASQNLVDGVSRKDFRGGRSGAINIIPSSTGAAKAIGLVIPEVKGKLTGMAFRVPTPNVSVVDLTFKPNRRTSIAELNGLMKNAATSYLKGILEYSEDPVVSTDLNHNPASAVYDAAAALELNDSFFKLIAWYDNEWAYSNRLVDLVKVVK
ncbi:MAG: type I glyceraldehyde-3-phosphate dehydrogenase [Candidatus Dojkabacteria bacterium]